MNVDAGRNFGERECPACACRVPANHNRCPICGYEFPQTPPRRQGMKVGGALLMLALFLFLALGLSRCA